MQYILLALVPLLIECTYCFLKGKRIVKTSCVFIEMISLLCVAIIFIALRNRLTAYEYVAIEAMLSIFLAYLILPAINHSVNSENILMALCMVSIIAMIYSILTYGQTVIHGDTATGLLLAESQMKHMSIFPKSWNYGNGDIWILYSNFYTLPFFMIVKDQSIARMLGSCTVYIILCLTIFMLSKKIYKDNSWVIMIVIISLYIAGQTGFPGYAGSAQDSMFYQAASCGVFTVLLLIVVWSMYIENRTRYWLLAFYLIITVALCSSGLRNMAEMVLPLAITMAVIYYENRLLGCDEREHSYKNLIIDEICILFPAGIGYILYEKLLSVISMRCGNFGTDMHFTSNFDMLREGIHNYFKAMFEVFGYWGDVSPFSLHGLQNFISIFSCILLCIVVPILQIAKLSDEDYKTQYMTIYMLVHNLILFMTIVFFGVMPNARYLLSSVLLSTIVSAHYIYKYFLYAFPQVKSINVCAFCAISAICMGTLLLNSNGWNEILAEEKELSKVLLDKGLTKGYASYWNAYNNYVYSDGKINYCGIDLENDWVTAYYWLCDTESFYQDADKSFIILNEREYCWDGRIKTIFGEPKEYFVMDGLHIYIYDYDLWNKMASGLSGGLNRPNVMEYEGAEIVTDGTLKIEPQGYASGPNTHLFAGEYTVTYTGNDIGDADFAVKSEEHPEALSYEEISRSNNEVVYRLTNTFDRIMDIEYMLTNYTNHPMNLESINIE